jgi:hypothetical protein
MDSRDTVDGTRVHVLAVEQPRAEALDLGEVAARNLILGRDLRERRLQA